MELRGRAVPYNEFSDDWVMIMPGAFDGLLKAGISAPLLFEHKPHLVVGEVVSLENKEDGLHHISVLYDTPAGRDVKRLFEAGVLDSFSIGYSFNPKRYPRDGSFQYIGEVLVFDELSVVSQPAYASAVMQGKRSKKEESNLERKNRLEAFWDVRIETPEIHDTLRLSFKLFYRHYLESLITQQPIKIY